MHKKLWNKDYILMLQANAVSTIGDMMYSVAIGYWVYEKTGSSGLMGIMSAISMFVFMLLSPFSGGIADKCNRKWIMVGMDAMQGVLMLSVGILAYMDRLSVGGVMFVAFLAAVGSVLYSPAVSTLMIDIIPHEDMVRGQSIHSSVNTMISLVGNAFSGAMVAFFGVPLIVVINGLSNLYSAFSELFIHVPKTAQQGTKVTVQGLLRDSKQAIKAIFTDRFMSLFIPCALIVNLLGAGPTSLLLPLCMEKGFTVEMYGILMSAMTAASLICVVLLGIIKLTPKTRFFLMALGFFCSEVLFILGFCSSQFLPACVLVFLATFFNGVGNAVFNASLMLSLPEENRGVILGFIQSASIGGSALSAVIYGLLGEVMPLYLLFSLGSAISLVPMMYLCLSPRTKEFILNH